MDEKAKKVKVVALSNGQMVIGKLRKTETERVMLEIDDPVVLLLDVNPETQQLEIQFHPFYPMIKRPVQIPWNGIAFSGDPDEQLLDSYRELTTGIVTAQPNDVPNLSLTE